jgi:hypothetical protein
LQLEWVDETHGRHVEDVRKAFHLDVSGRWRRRPTHTEADSESVVASREVVPELDP